MRQGFLKRCFSFFLCFLIAFSYPLSSVNSAAFYDDERTSSYDSDEGKCDTGSIAFNPFYRNKDLVWEFANPHCAGFIAGLGTAMVTAGNITRWACNATNDIGKLKISYEQAVEMEWDYPILTPSVPRKIANRLSRCLSRWSEVGTWTSLAAAAGITGVAGLYYGGQATAATADANRCCAAEAAYVATVGAAMAALATMYAVAKTSYENSTICGEGWTKWKQDCKDSKDTGNEVCDNDKKIWVKSKGDYQECLIKVFSSDYKDANGVYDPEYIRQCRNSRGNDFKINETISITNKNYREFIFGGIEIEDSGGCENPDWGAEEKMKRLGYNEKYQRYYTRGSGNSISFACHRFLSSNPNDKEAAKAFSCCKDRSQVATCVHGVYGLSDVDKSSDDRFCTVGERCNIKGLTFEVYDSRSTPNYLCVKSYSLCPYNHLLGGGTEKAVPNPADLSTTKNTCQYMNHCTKVPIVPYVRMTNMQSAFISSACKNIKGDSQNFYSYNADVIPLNIKNFSAPIAQCFKETLENVLLNKSGDSECADLNEIAVDGVCASGEYRYQKGHTLVQKSFFKKLQERLQSFIKILLVVSITMFGVAILFAVPGAAIERKKLLPYIVKIGLVLYFATGNAWQTTFVEGVLNSSTMLSEMMFNVDEAKDPSKLDGCQFPRYNYSNTSEDTKYDNPAYPPQKGYLKIWDTLDCKIANTLGFGPSLAVPNIILMLIGGLLTSGLGIVFFVACLALSFLIIAIAIRALHIFLLSVISIVLLIYISPITIAASLFERTKGIFQGWLKQLLGFTLQPVILFAYLAVMITIFDYVAIGPDVRFEGDGKKQVKRMICSGKAADTSLYCIFRAPNIKTNHALEVIGIGIPFLVSMNATKVNTIIKGVFLMFIFYEFMEKISYFASKLVGGKELKGSAPNIAGALKKVAGAAYGVQKRFTGMVAKHGVSAARGGINAAKSVGRSATDNGKAIAKTKDSSFSNATGGAGSSVATGGSTPAAATSSPASSSATGSTPPTS